MHLLLLHAFPLSNGMWTDFRATLEREGHCVLTPDYPGFGGTAGAVSSLPDLAGQIWGLLEPHPNAPFVLGGLSMGGYLLMEMLRQNPNDPRVRGLVFASTKLEADGEEARASREAQARRALETRSVAFLESELLPKLLSPNAPEAAREKALALLRQASPEGVAGAQRAMAARPDSRAVLERVQVPTLVLAGEHDFVTPPETVQHIAQAVPGTRFQVLEGAGHLANLERPEFDGRVLDFVRTLG